MLDRRRDVAGDDLFGIVEQRQNDRPAGVDVLAEDLACDRAQAVREQRHLERVLADALGDGAAHQHPALDKPQAVQVGEEVALGTAARPLSARRWPWLGRPGA